MRTRLLAGFAAGFLLIALVACGGSAATNAPAATGAPSAAPVASAAGCNNNGGGDAVAIANFAFDPPELSVSVGSTVTWTNQDSATHTVSFDGGPDCGNVSSGASVSRTFDAPGIYPYHCNIHSSMKGTITVQ